ncbi:MULTISPECIES: DUF2203 domain-containing protein [Acidianus]|uniref:DUF2203 domain-containing protein n=1 Tax=Candidatus Acidianus copahuensis TaxID=1160895 RepID=A0A031LPJ9_9CREN|nr:MULTISPECIES: DUF2203 family protein [Acidianus]EZQ07007.1 hypothetical protein CM19_06515 [Candidatus Acidianus copahuensis]NON61165.1 DUF2203 family protein [Acidianus sp. RZ1]
MSYSYFDLQTASSLLPWLKEKLMELKELKGDTERALVDGRKESLSVYVMHVDKIIREISEKGIIVRDPELGLVDFPAIINGRPAFLCWKFDEDEIMYWHYIEEGFVGRKRITGKEEILSYT